MLTSASGRGVSYCEEAFGELVISGCDSAVDVEVSEHSFPSSCAGDGGACCRATDCRYAIDFGGIVAATLTKAAAAALEGQWTRAPQEPFIFPDACHIILIALAISHHVRFRAQPLVAAPTGTRCVLLGGGNYHQNIVRNLK